MYPGMRSRRATKASADRRWFETLAKAERSHAKPFPEGPRLAERLMREGSLEAPTRHPLDLTTASYDSRISVERCRVGASSEPSRSIRQRVEGLLETVGVAALGLGERLEPAAISPKPSSRAASPCRDTCRCIVGFARHRRLRLSRVRPIGRLVAGSPTASRYCEVPVACPVSPSAVERRQRRDVVLASTSALARSRDNGGLPAIRRRTRP